VTWPLSNHTSADLHRGIFTRHDHKHLETIWMLLSGQYADTLYIRFISIHLPEHITNPRMSEVKVRWSSKFILDHDYYRCDVTDFNEVVVENLLVRVGGMVIVPIPNGGSSVQAARSGARDGGIAFHGAARRLPANLLDCIKGKEYRGDYTYWTSITRYQVHKRMPIACRSIVSLTRFPTQNGHNVVYALSRISARVDRRLVLFV